MPLTHVNYARAVEAELRRIAHLDMDAFYASVELLRYPQLRDLPLVIGGGRDLLNRRLVREGLADAASADIPVDTFPRLQDYVGRGVITTATYAARQFGVGSAMGLMKAARLCPQAILLPVDFAEYRRFSRAFKEVILGIAPTMEDRGVDEVYIDFTRVPGGQREGGRVLARLIQKSIRDATGLSCSIGVAPNKLIAKMASEFHKPGGIAVVHDEDLRSQIWPLPVRKIKGIGPKAEAKLHQLGVRQIGEMAAHPREWLVEHFGKAYGAWLHDAAWGRDDRPVVTHSEPVSMSRETTFDRDLHAVHDRAELGEIFTTLCEQLGADLQRKGYAGRTIGVKLRFEDFQIVTRDVSIDGHVNAAHLLRAAAGLALRKAPLAKRLRLLGVRAARLARVDELSPHDLNAPLDASAGLPRPAARTGAAPSDAHDRNLRLFDDESVRA